MLQKHMSGVILVKFQLQKGFLKEVLECALLSDDLLRGYVPVLRETLASL